MATLFTIAKGRGGDVLKGLLGEGFAGVVASDRWTAYPWLGVLRRQVCWAHLARDFQGLVDRGGPAKAVGQPALWTFVTVPGVAPTNNAAERAVRPAVLWPKQSLETQTDAGNQFVARLLSVATTCQQQRRALPRLSHRRLYGRPAWRPDPFLTPPRHAIGRPRCLLAP